MAVAPGCGVPAEVRAHVRDVIRRGGGGGGGGVASHVGLHALSDLAASHGDGRQ